MNRRDFILLSSLLGTSSLFGKSFSLDVMKSTLGEDKEQRQQSVNYYKQGYLPKVIYRDEIAQKALTELAQPFFKTSQRQDVEWEIFLSDEGQVNAFTIGYGFVVIDISLIKYCCDSETDLVAVIAHEVGHVTYKHAERRMKMNALYQQFDLAKYDPLIQKRLHSSYNRLWEHEADAYMIKSFLKTGYDIHQASNLMKNLGNVFPSSQSVEQCMFSTHPDVQNRIQKLDSIASTFTQNSSKVYNPKAFEYLKNRSLA